MPSTILSDNGASSGSAGLKTTAASDGILALQTTTAGGTVTTAVTIDTSQNVGVGVTPSAWGSLKSVDVSTFGGFFGFNNQAGVTSNAYFSGTSWTYKGSGPATLYQQIGGAHNWQIATSGTAGNAITFTQAMTLDASGNLALGSTTSLSSSSNRVDLTVNGTSSSMVSFGTGGTRRGYALHDATDFSIASETAGALRFLNNGAERARIDSSGNLLVGTTSSANSTYSVATFRGANKGIAIQDSGTSGYRAIYINSGSLYFFNGTNEGYLSSAGAWTNASDGRLKTNVREIEYGLSTVLATQPRHYERTDVDGTYIGFVAQELQNIIPEVVSGDPEKQLGVDYGSLVAVAFKAIQEQQAIIEQLKADVAALKGNA